MAGDGPRLAPFTRSDRGPMPAMSHLDRLPPHNLEAELGVLGSILLDNDTLHEVRTMLAPADFYRETHGDLWSLCCERYDAGQGFDAILIHDHARATGRLGRFGPGDGTLDGLDELLTSAMASVPHTAHARYYAAIVRQKAVGRDLIESAQATLHESYGDTLDAEELLARAQSRFLDIAERRAGGDLLKPMGDVARRSYDRVLARMGGTPPGVPTGFARIDHLAGPFQAGQVVIVAARPRVGKTAFALNACEHAARAGKRVLFVSLEMADLEIGERFLAAVAGVNGYGLREPARLSGADHVRLGDAIDRIASWGIDLVDAPTLTMPQIGALARLKRARTGLDLIVIDYMQLVEPEESRGVSREQQVARVSRRCKVLAKDLGVPVFALSQLNREVEKRADKRPILADLRESGAIEQDADVAILLHRPEVDDPADRPGYAEAILAKNRSGAAGIQKLTYDGATTRFAAVREFDEPGGDDINWDQERPF